MAALAAAGRRNGTPDLATAGRRIIARATDKRAKRGRRAHRRKDLQTNRYGTMLHACYPYASYRLHLVCCWGVATHCLRYGCGGVVGEDPECVRQKEM